MTAGFLDNSRAIHSAKPLQLLRWLFALFPAGSLKIDLIMLCPSVASKIKSPNLWTERSGVLLLSPPLLHGNKVALFYPERSRWIVYLRPNPTSPMASILLCDKAPSLLSRMATMEGSANAGSSLASGIDEGIGRDEKYPDQWQDQSPGCARESRTGLKNN